MVDPALDTAGAVGLGGAGLDTAGAVGLRGTALDTAGAVGLRGGGLDTAGAGLEGAAAVGCGATRATGTVTPAVVDV